MNIWSKDLPAADIADEIVELVDLANDVICFEPALSFGARSDVLTVTTAEILPK